MKFVFKKAGALAALAVVLSLPRPVAAQAIYFNTRDLLADFFRASHRVTYTRVELTPGDRARLRARLGYEPAKASYTFFIAHSDARTGDRAVDRIDGYALIDEEYGEHQPITFAVKIQPNGAIERQEVVVYREARGDEVRDLNFRKQFVGKTATDPIAPDRDIAVVSGATISSRAMAVGVKRALVLFELFVRPSVVPARLGALASPQPGKL